MPALFDALLAVLPRDPRDGAWGWLPSTRPPGAGRPWRAWGLVLGCALAVLSCGKSSDDARRISPARPAPSVAADPSMEAAELCDLLYRAPRRKLLAACPRRTDLG